MDEVAKRFADLTEKYGPSVVEAAKSAAQVEGYSCLMSGALTAAAGLLVACAGRYFWRRQKAESFDDAEIAWVAGVVLMGIGGVICAIGLWQWLDPWTWAAINHPELWIAKRALGL